MWVGLVREKNDRWEIAQVCHKYDPIDEITSATPVRCAFSFHCELESVATKATEVSPIHEQRIRTLWFAHTHIQQKISRVGNTLAPHAYGPCPLRVAFAYTW